MNNLQSRGVPEFGQRTASGFPQAMDPMANSWISGEYVGDVFAKSEKWVGTPPVPDVGKWTSREANILGWQSYIYDLTAWVRTLWLKNRIGSKLLRSSV